MGQEYQRLCSEERNFIQRSLNLGHDIRLIANSMGRSRVTIWREIRRNALKRYAYNATAVGLSSQPRRGLVKLREGSAVRHYAFGQIRLACSPQ